MISVTQTTTFTPMSLAHQEFRAVPLPDDMYSSSTQHAEWIDGLTSCSRLATHVFQQYKKLKIERLDYVLAIDLLKKTQLNSKELEYLRKDQSAIEEQIDQLKPIVNRWRAIGKHLGASLTAKKDNLQAHYHAAEEELMRCWQKAFSNPEADLKQSEATHKLNKAQRTSISSLKSQATTASQPRRKSINGTYLAGKLKATLAGKSKTPLSPTSPKASKAVVIAKDLNPESANLLTQAANRAAVCFELNQQAEKSFAKIQQMDPLNSNLRQKLHALMLKRGDVPVTQEAPKDPVVASLSLVF